MFSPKITSYLILKLPTMPRYLVLKVTENSISITQILDRSEWISAKFSEVQRKQFKNLTIRSKYCQSLAKIIPLIQKVRDTQYLETSQRREDFDNANLIYRQTDISIQKDLLTIRHYCCHMYPYFIGHLFHNHIQPQLTIILSTGLIS